MENAKWKMDSPPETGGVAAPLIKCCEATEAAQTGVVAYKLRCGMRFDTWCVSDHPVRALFGRGTFS